MNNLIFIRKIKVSILILIISFCQISIAKATTNQFQAFDAWPVVGEKYFLTNDSSEGLYQKQFYFELSNQFLYKSLSLLNSSGTVIDNAVEKSLIHFISAGVGITDSIQASVTIPYVSLATFADPNISPFPAKRNVSTFGDVRLSSKLGIINHYKHRFGFALEPFVTIPTKGSQYFLGEKSVTGGIKAVGDYLFSKKIRAAFNTGFQYFSNKVQLNNIEYQARILAGTALSTDVSKQVSLSAEMTTTSSLKNFGRRDTTTMSLMAGTQWKINDTGLKLGGGIGTCLVCGARAPKIQGVVNLAYTGPESAYRIKDQESIKTMEVTLGIVPEKMDERVVFLKGKCPADVNDYNPKLDDPDCAMFFQIKDSVVELTQKMTPEKFGEVVLALQQSCPEDPKLFDPEKNDPDCLKLFKIKEQIVVLTGSETNLNFSEVLLAMKQNCPQTRQEFDPAVHDPSCLKYFELKQEILPLIAKTDKEKQALDLIMTGEDSDHDNIPDAFDDCPQDPEDMNGIADSDGCPESGITVVKGEIKTIAPVHFDFNKTTLSAESKEILGYVSDTLIRHPEIKTVEVVGHADRRGTVEANEKISLRRAQIVIKYLQIRGVPDDLVLVPKGLGTQFPVAPEDTEEGRQQNRRVEFHFTEK
ncbi:MAG: OmpA family protein [Deltaproteobacteria bacterium]|nr:MAG: OmpA family protein [Deltaproteobacteria bacterium]